MVGKRGVKCLKTKLQADLISVLDMCMNKSTYNAVGMRSNFLGQVSIGLVPSTNALAVDVFLIQVCISHLDSPMAAVVED